LATVGHGLVVRRDPLAPPRVVAVDVPAVPGGVGHLVTGRVDLRPLGPGPGSAGGDAAGEQGKAGHGGSDADSGHVRDGWPPPPRTYVVWPTPGVGPVMPGLLGRWTPSGTARRLSASGRARGTTAAPAVPSRSPPATSPSQVPGPSPTYHGLRRRRRAARSSGRPAAARPPCTAVIRPIPPCAPPSRPRRTSGVLPAPWS